MKNTYRFHCSTRSPRPLCRLAILWGEEDTFDFDIFKRQFCSRISLQGVSLKIFQDTWIKKDSWVFLSTHFAIGRTRRRRAASDRSRSSCRFCSWQCWRWSAGSGRAEESTRTSRISHLVRRRSVRVAFASNSSRFEPTRKILFRPFEALGDCTFAPN